MSGIYKHPAPGRIVLICQHCNTPIYVQPAVVARAPVKFCSVACRRAAQGTPAERFMRRYLVDDATGCWNWTGSKDTHGYGQLPAKALSPTGGNLILAHRFSLYHFKGFSLDTPLVVMHKCDNPACVNPAHLQVGTFRDNNDDRDTKGRTVVNRGSKNGSAQLNETDVISIRQRCANGEARRSIAAEFKTSYATISHIVNRRNWKHLP